MIAPPIPQPPPEKVPKWIFIPVGLALVGLLFLIAIWQFLAPSDRRAPAAFTDFLSDVHAGRVSEIKIHDREYTYRLNDADGGVGAIRETIGPVADQAVIDGLKPDDTSKAKPKIIFDK